MVKSIANQEAIERFIRKVDEARKQLNTEENPPPQRTRTSPSEHHHIAESSRDKKDLTTWLGARCNDPAFTVSWNPQESNGNNPDLQDFFPQLKDHLLARARSVAYEGDEHEFSEDDRDCINIKDNFLYFHSLLRVNYTTYDLRREQDTINPLTRPDILVLSHEDEKTHPYWYARIVHIFHVMVQHRNNPSMVFSVPTRMNVLFVRWFRRDVNYPSGWNEKRLHRLQFFDQESPSDAFGFLNPESVVRGVHIIPAFGYARTYDLLAGGSDGRRLRDEDDPNADWKYYYVNM